jgi:hypothetical protein
MENPDTGYSAPSPEAAKKPVKYRIYSQEQAFRHMTLWRSEKEQLLYTITDEILFNVWDALCLSIDQEYREVYLPYLPHVFDLLKETEDGHELCDYLVFIEESQMGAVNGDPLVRRRAWRAVDVLMKYRANILAHPEDSDAP